MQEDANSVLGVRILCCVRFIIIDPLLLFVKHCSKRMICGNAKHDGNAVGSGSPSRLVQLLQRCVLGQMVSFAVAATGVFTTLLVNHNVSFPLLQSATSYLWLTLIFVPTYAYALKRLRRQGPNYGQFKNFTPMEKLWRYPLIAVVDLEANYVVVKAYQYTDMTSVQLLDCATIPFVMVLSVLFLGAAYSKGQLIGALIAVGGLGFLIALDADGLSRSAHGPNPVLGDLLCIVSSACYAISNVACEKLIKRERSDAYEGESETSCQERRTDVMSSPSSSTCLAPTQTGRLFRQDERRCGAEIDAAAQDNACLLPADHSSSAIIEHGVLWPDAPAYLPVLEYLACMPLCALAFATIQCGSIEGASIMASMQGHGLGEWSAVDVVYQLSFGLSMVAVYVGMPVLFCTTSATLANLSLLTADVYSIIWNVSLFGIPPKWMFCVAYLVIVTGIVLFDTDALGKLRISKIKERLHSIVSFHR